MTTTRNLSRARVLFARAFADNYFSDDSDLFAARLLDEGKEILALAQIERERLVAYWERMERRSMGPDE